MNFIPPKPENLKDVVFKPLPRLSNPYHAHYANMVDLPTKPRPCPFPHIPIAKPFGIYLKIRDQSGKEWWWHVQEKTVNRIEEALGRKILASDVFALRNATLGNEQDNNLSAMPLTEEDIKRRQGDSEFHS